MNPRQILLGDDSSRARRSARQMLAAQGHVVEEAGDGAQALERYVLGHHDIGLLDMVMTGMYGLEVLAKLREFDPQVRVIVVTADIQKSTEEQARASGASAFINKPLNRTRLHETVSAVLEGTFQWN